MSRESFNITPIADATDRLVKQVFGINTHIILTVYQVEPTEGGFGINHTCVFNKAHEDVVRMIRIAELEDEPMDQHTTPMHKPN